MQFFMRQASAPLISIVPSKPSCVWVESMSPPSSTMDQSAHLPFMCVLQLSGAPCIHVCVRASGGVASSPSMRRSLLTGSGLDSLGRPLLPPSGERLKAYVCHQTLANTRYTAFFFWRNFTFNTRTHALILMLACCCLSVCNRPRPVFRAPPHRSGDRTLLTSKRATCGRAATPRLTRNVCQRWRL